MISVLVNPQAQPWVREFFELFKTPWRFHEPGNDSEVLICAGVDDLPETASKLVIVYNSTRIRWDEQSGQQAGEGFEGALLEHGADRIPIYGRCQGLANHEASLLKVTGTDLSAAFIQEHSGQTVIRVGYDLFKEVRHLLAHGQNVAHAMIPSLDLHIEMLRRWIVQSGVRLVEIPPVPAGYHFGVCLTHDMDHPAIRFHGLDHTLLGFIGRASLGSLAQTLGGRMTLAQLWRNWTALLKLPFVYLGLAKDFWRQTDRYLEIERGLGSTFFVIPEKGNPGRAVDREHSTRRASAYGAQDVSAELQQMAVAGHEIALHGIDAWLDAGSGRAESDKVAKASGQPAKGVRMHWLCFNEQSPQALEAAGFDYDSTVGFNQCIGFRAGTLQVYQPPGTKRLLELPLHVMDTAMFYPGYLNYTDAQAVESVGVLMNQAKRLGGVMTINWHDRSLAPERCWDGVYLQLLKLIRNERVWFATADRAVAWFRCRRETAITDTLDATGQPRVRVRVPAWGKNFPGMTVRIHNVREAGREVSQVKDIPISSEASDEIQVHPLEHPVVA